MSRFLNWLTDQSFIHRSSFYPPSSPSLFSYTPFSIHPHNPMPAPISTPEAFITSVICKLSSLSPSSSSSSSSHPQPRDPNVSTSPVSPSTPQTFSTRLSALPKEKQESITRLLTTLHFLFPHEFIPALDLLDRGLITRMVIGSLSATTPTSASINADFQVEYQHSLHQPATELAYAPDAQIARTGDDPDHQTDTKPDPEVETKRRRENEVFYIQSASSQTLTNTTRHPHPRRQQSNQSTAYEVRLASWNCTCPAFAFSAFGRTLDLNRNDDDDDNGYKQHSHSTAEDNDSLGHMDSAKAGKNLKWRFGGTLTRSSTTDPESGPGGRGRSVPVPVPVCKHILAALLGKHIPGLFASGVQLRNVSTEEGAGWAGGWGDGD